MWPRGAWKSLYEPVIRRAAGLGRAPDAAGSRPLRAALRPLRRAGGGRGTAGIAAALAAADAGARVMLCDETGRIRRQPAGRYRGAHRRRCRRSTGSRRAVAELAPQSARHAAARTTAFGYFPHNFLGLNERLTDHLAEPPAGSRASACGRCGRGRSCSPPARSSVRWCFRATTGRASCWPAPRRPISTATACGSGGASSWSPPATPPIRPRSICGRRGVGVAAVADVRAQRRAESARRGARRRHRGQAGGNGARHRRRSAGQGDHPGRSGGEVRCAGHAASSATPC